MSGALTKFIPFKNQPKTPTVTMSVSSGKKKGVGVEIKVLTEKIDQDNVEYEIVFQKGFHLFF